MKVIKVPTIKEWLIQPQFKMQAEEDYYYGNDPRVVYRLKDNMGFIERQIFQFQGETCMIVGFCSDLIHFGYHTANSTENHFMEINKYQQSWGDQSWFDESHGKIDYSPIILDARTSPHIFSVEVDDDLPF